MCLFLWGLAFQLWEKAAFELVIWDSVFVCPGTDMVPPLVPILVYLSYTNKNACNCLSPWFLRDLSILVSSQDKSFFYFKFQRKPNIHICPPPSYTVLFQVNNSAAWGVQIYLPKLLFSRVYHHMGKLIYCAQAELFLCGWDPADVRRNPEATYFLGAICWKEVVARWVSVSFPK